MKETIYLTLDRSKVIKMNKKFTDLRRNEICVKLNVEVEDKAFGNPTIEQSIHIDSWNRGVDMSDVEFNQNIITQEEADVIREKRLEKMREILEKEGFQITKKEEVEE